MSDHDRPIRNALLALLTCLQALGFGALFLGLVTLYAPVLVSGIALTASGVALGIVAFFRAMRGRR